MNREMIRLILERASADELFDKSLEMGMVPLLQEGLSRIEKGETTIAEVARVCLLYTSRCV